LPQGFAHPQVYADLRTLLGRVAPEGRQRVRAGILYGDLPEVLLETAAGYDLIVMATSKLAPVAKVLVGSVTEALLQAAPCPVMVVRPTRGNRFPRAVILKAKDGTPILVRPIVPEDGYLIRQGLKQLSAESRYRRFLAPIRELSDEQLVSLTELDYEDHMAWTAVSLEDPAFGMLGVARYKRLEEEPTVAEAAVTVLDARHGNGIGSLLLGALNTTAAKSGISTFRAYVLQENAPMQRMLEQLNAVVAPDSQGCLRCDVPVTTSDDALPNTPLGKVFKAVARRMMPPPAVRFLYTDALRKVVDSFGDLF
jgi:GNAT superfamily N-acetyltransferase